MTLGCVACSQALQLVPNPQGSRVCGCERKSKQTAPPHAVRNRREVLENLSGRDYTVQIVVTDARKRHPRHEKRDKEN
jgi:hypothetical protein